MEIVVYTLPEYWACYLINDDASGLEDDEINEIDEFLKDGEIGYCIGVSEDRWFAHSNDATNMGCDVCEYTFRVKKAVV